MPDSTSTEKITAIEFQIDAMVKVSDVYSLPAMHELTTRLGRSVGASTGSNLIAALACMVQMRTGNETGSVVTLLCDSGKRYGHTYYNEQWLQNAGLSCQRKRAALAASFDSGQITDELSTTWRIAGELTSD